MVCFGRDARRCFVVGAVLAFVLAFASVASGAERPFSLRFGDNLQGNMAFASNVLVYCPDTEATCDAGGTPANQSDTANNNNRVLDYLDVDSDAATPNSSTATLTIPAGAEVVFAGLYWGGRPPTDFDDTDQDDVDDFLSVLIDTPAPGGYEAVTGTQLDTTSVAWQGFADVTSLVNAAGSGEYTVADVAIGRAVGGATSNYGGWALWVVYEDPSERWRNVSVFDGLVEIGPTQDINLAGFVTPPSGNFSVAAGVTGYEGDRNSTGDQLRLNGTNLTDALTPANNFFNSRITRFGVDDLDRDPAFPNQLGYDTKIVDASGILANNSTSATVTVTSASETYFPGVIATAIDLYAPKVSGTKDVQNITRPGQPARPGETLEYTLTFENAAEVPPDDLVDDAVGFVVADAIPVGTTYLPGSLEVVAGDPGAGPRTDASGDDSAEYDAVTDSVEFRVGAGANATTGGTLAPGESVTVRFRVTVDANVGGGAIDNEAVGDFLADTLDEPFSASANASIDVEPTADLRLEKSAPAAAKPGSEFTYTLAVFNDGPGDSPAATVSDTLPAGVTYVSDNAGCDTAALPAIQCTTAPIPAGTSQTIEIVVRVDENAAGQVQNAASVTGPLFDPDTSDNDDSTTTAIEPLVSDLRLVKTASNGQPKPGEQVTYTLTVTNNGPDPSPQTVLTDVLPDELAYVSDNGGCDTSALPTVKCDLGTLAVGESKSVEIVAKVRKGATGQITNSASVSGGNGDSNPADNEDSEPVRTSGPSAAKGGPKLAVSKATKSKRVRPGSVVSYRIVVRNKGGATARSVRVCDVLPSGQKALRAPGAKVKGDRVCWKLKRLAAGAKRAFKITTQVAMTSPIATQVNRAIAKAKNAKGRAVDEAAVRVEPVTGGCFVGARC